VEDSRRSNLLHSLFMVRTRYLLQQYPGKLNQSYLSGLLIGSEVGDLANPAIKGITLVSSIMSDYYEVALRTLQVPAQVGVLPDEAVTAKGQLAIVSGHAAARTLFNGD